MMHTFATATLTSLLSLHGKTVGRSDDMKQGPSRGVALTKVRMKMTCGKPEREIRRTLQDTGLPWSLEMGKKHLRIILAGRQIGIMSKGNRVTGTRGLENLVATIRRAARLHGQTI